MKCNKAKQAIHFQIAWNRLKESIMKCTTTESIREEPYESGPLEESILISLVSSPYTYTVANIGYSLLTSNRMVKARTTFLLVSSDAKC